MNSSETSIDEPAGRRITLTITGADLPDNEDDLQPLLEGLEEAASTVLTDAIGESNLDIESWLGHFYATVRPTCPDCGRLLDLQSIYLGEGGDAYSLAICSADCGWSGDAMFKVIDLDRGVGEEDYESTVLTGETTPIYRPYTDREI